MIEDRPDILVCLFVCYSMQEYILNSVEFREAINIWKFTFIRFFHSILYEF